MNTASPTGTSTNRAQINFATTIVPEPTSVALLGLGGLAAIGRRRRRN